MKRKDRYQHQLMPSDSLLGASLTSSEQDSLLCTLPRTTLPKLAPLRHTTTPSMQVTVNPFSGAICDMTTTTKAASSQLMMHQPESEYASVVYSSPTNIRRFNRLQYSSTLSSSSRSPQQLTRLRPNLSSSATSSPAHRSIVSSTTTLSTCISPRSGRYLDVEQQPVNPYQQHYNNADHHHIYCEIPLNSNKDRLRNLRSNHGGRFAAASRGGCSEDAEFFGEDATQCDLHNISDLSDDEHGQTTTFSELSSMHSSPIRSNFGPRRHLIQQGSPKKRVTRNLAPPPLKHDMSQLPATDV